jgi:hypothetical protein
MGCLGVPAPPTGGSLLSLLLLSLLRLLLSLLRLLVGYGFEGCCAHVVKVLC